MANGKQVKNIVATVETASKRCEELVASYANMDAATFKDSALRLSLELIKYGEYIKTTLLLGNAAARSEPAEKKALTKQDVESLQGASDEEREAVIHTPPPGFVK